MLDSVQYLLFLPHQALKPIKIKCKTPANSLFLFLCRAFLSKFLFQPKDASLARSLCSKYKILGSKRRKALCRKSYRQNKREESGNGRGRGYVKASA